MKIVESGMPEQARWEGFFSPTDVLLALGLTPDCAEVLDFGCGYGTFALPAVRMVRGLVRAYDIDPAMVKVTHDLAADAGLARLKVEVRDLHAKGTGRPAGATDYVMMFNVLHGPTASALIREAARVLKCFGRAGVIHWRDDPATPAGPPMDLRVRPEAVARVAEVAGFAVEEPGAVDLPPYHWGLVLRRLPE